MNAAAGQQHARVRFWPSLLLQHAITLGECWSAGSPSVAPFSILALSTSFPLSSFRPRSQGCLSHSCPQPGNGAADKKAGWRDSGSRVAAAGADTDSDSEGPVAAAGPGPAAQRLRDLQARVSFL